CAGRGDRDEAPKPVTPECADGQDNDLDGRIDYPEDDGCTAASDYDERGPCGNEYDPPRLQDGVPLRLDTAGGVFESQGSCGGQGSPELAALYRLTNVIEALEITTVDPATDVVTTLYVRREACLVPGAEVACQTQRENAAPGHTLRVESPTPGDYYIFVDGVAGAGGVVMLTVNEIPLAACLNTVDDDGDGRADYPNDPGCFAPFDRDETTEALTACSNDEDDDEDGQIDFPLDPGCPSAAFDSEENSCGEIRFREFFGETPEVVAELADGSNGLSGTCGGRNHNEVIFRYDLPFNARMEISTRFSETTTPVALYVRRDCDDTQTQLGCDDGAAGGANGGRIVLSQAAPGPYYIVVDGREADAGQFKLAVNVERLPAGCSNDRDDDDDGLRDYLDPGCSGPEDEDETDLPAGQTPACSNGEDDDGDGLVDWPFDPGCWGPGGLDEADPAEPPACDNGVDDDGDGRTDFPWDPGCVSRGHFSEVDPARAPTCADGQDNDADGRTDFPFDPGCFARSDSNEFDGPMNRGACANGLDDDGDGLIDFPFDPGCAYAALDDETDPAVLPACSNGEDDDGDGVVDFPREPGCAFAGDDDETNPVPLPVCGNGEDDDDDARVDFPDDPGCAYAAAGTEGNEAFVIPRCRDGVDNDDDGLIDVADPGCVTADDDDETDPAEAPECGNDADDDGDGLADFPADPGCVARGDDRESQDCREGVDVTPIPANGTVNGSTAMDGADQYATRCGGQGAPDAVYRYVLEEAGTLVVSADNPGTDFPPIVSVLRNCEERETVVGCAGHIGRPTPTVRVEDAQPGEYYIFVDGGGPERWASAGEPVTFVDPEGYVATPDITDDCWEDGGAGAFDCYGDLIRITHGEDEALVSPAPGTRMGMAGDYGFTVDSRFVNTNIWRLHFTPAEPGDDRPVSFRLEG
ncbi:MAG: hypothetical protein KC583_04085, partial [Myxococcales bacterium]|nr:hypothetical protein [Myxococcales bacterium]